MGSDLIRKDDAIKGIESVPDGNWSRERYAKEIKRIPPVDAVIVVRCKECGYWKANNAEEGDFSGECRNPSSPCCHETTDAYWFCADGEGEDNA